jgi:hypothetical protein
MGNESQLFKGSGETVSGLAAMGAGARPKDTRAELQSISPRVLGSKSACRNLDGKSGKVTREKLRNR